MIKPSEKLIEIFKQLTDAVGTDDCIAYTEQYRIDNFVNDEFDVMNAIKRENYGHIIGIRLNRIDDNDRNWHYYQIVIETDMKDANGCGDSCIYINDDLEVDGTVYNEIHTYDDGLCRVYANRRPSVQINDFCILHVAGNVA